MSACYVILAHVTWVLAQKWALFIRTAKTVTLPESGRLPGTLRYVSMYVVIPHAHMLKYIHSYGMIYTGQGHDNADACASDSNTYGICSTLQYG